MQADIPALDTAADSALFPFPRPLTQSVDVARVGVFVSRAGIASRAPVTATLAAEDLDAYDQQLEVRYPADAADSVAHLRLHRAQQWWAQLRVLHGAAVTGHHRLPLAMVAFRAHDEMAARQIIDTRVAELSTQPVEQALTLVSAVVLWADATQDHNRLVQHLPVANVYLTRLLALSLNGIRLHLDSLAIQAQQWFAVRTVWRATTQLSDDEVMRALDTLLAFTAHLPHDARVSVLSNDMPYWYIAAAVMKQPNGRAQFDSLNARLFQLATWRAHEWPLAQSAAERARSNAEVRRTIQQRVQAFTQIGQLAPAIVAHAWLNTADSLYVAAPVTHTLADGIIRVVAVGDRDDHYGRLPLLEYVQRASPTGVQVVYVTETRGYGGTDLLTPAEEVQWLQSYYAVTRHVTFPIAVWAGAKQPQEAPLPVSTFPFQRYVPEHSPMFARYAFLPSAGLCVIVDGHGRIRGYASLQRRADVTRLMQRLTTLRAEDPSVPTVESHD